MELGGAINIQFGVGRGKDANFDTDEQQLWWSNIVPHKREMFYLQFSTRNYSFCPHNTHFWGVLDIFQNFHRNKFCP